MKKQSKNNSDALLGSTFSRLSWRLNGLSTMVFFLISLVLLSSCNVYRNNVRLTGKEVKSGDAKITKQQLLTLKIGDHISCMYRENVNDEWLSIKGRVSEVGEEHVTIKRKPLLYVNTDSTEFSNYMNKQIQFDQIKKIRYDLSYGETIGINLMLAVVVAGVGALIALSGDWSSLSFSGG